MTCHTLVTQRQPHGGCRPVGSAALCSPSLAQRRTALHLTLYVAVVFVPLLGWAGISDFGAREIFPGYSLPAIFPEHAGYADLLFSLHAYLAFGLLALVAVHIGVAMQDYMMRAGQSDARD